MSILEIYKKSWRLLITNRTLLVWGLAYVIFLLCDKYLIEAITDLYCLNSVLELISGLIVLTTVGILILAIENALQNSSNTFQEIWIRLRKTLKKFLLVEISLGFLLVLVLFCFVALIGMANFFIPTIPDDMTSRITLARLPFGLVASSIGVFCTYGVVLHGMGIIKSIRHGLSVFAMNWVSCLTLYIMSSLPLLTLYAIIFLIEELNDSSPTLVSLITTVNTPPYRFWSILFSGIVFIFYSVNFQIAYHHFIDSFEYPTLKQITPES